MLSRWLCQERAGAIAQFVERARGAAELQHHQPWPELGQPGEMALQRAIPRRKLVVYGNGQGVLHAGTAHDAAVAEEPAEFREAASDGDDPLLDDAEDRP